MSIEEGSNSWYSPVHMRGQAYDFLIDSGASWSVITYKMYQTLPYPIPPLQPTNMKFALANGDSISARGVVHYPLR